MQTKTQTQKTSNQTNEALRQQLEDLVKEVRCTIAHPVRPEALKQALADSQQMLR